MFQRLEELGIDFGCGIAGKVPCFSLHLPQFVLDYYLFSLGILHHISVGAVG
jgi:hypothetical protein